MNKISTAFGKMSYGMFLISGSLLVFMMLTILTDVISRSIFGLTKGSVDFTFVGAVELVSYGLLFCVLFSLPYSVAKSQVIVDLFTEKMNDRLKSILSGIYTLGFSLLGLAMSVQFFESIHKFTESGETSQDLLIPLQYIYMVTTFATAVLAIRGFLVAVDLLQGREEEL